MWWIRKDNKPVEKLYRVIDVENGRDKTVPCFASYLRGRERVAKHLDKSSTGKPMERPFLSWRSTLPVVRVCLEEKLLLCRREPLSYKPASCQIVVAIDLHDCFDAGLYNDGTFVDLSAELNFDRYFSGFDGTGTEVDVEECKWAALAFDEVIFGVKGPWWYPFTEVIDPDCGVGMIPFGNPQQPPQWASSQATDKSPLPSPTAPPQPASSQRT